MRMGDLYILTYHSRWLLLRFEYSTKTKTKEDDNQCELTENVRHPDIITIATLGLCQPL